MGRHPRFGIYMKSSKKNPNITTSFYMNLKPTKSPIRTPRHVNYHPSSDRFGIEDVIYGIGGFIALGSILALFMWVFPAVFWTVIGIIGLIVAWGLYKVGKVIYKIGKVLYEDSQERKAEKNTKKVDF